MCAAAPEGEDKAGRQKLRVVAPDEVVERACELADQTFKQFEQRGWLVKLPELVNLQETAFDRFSRREALLGADGAKGEGQKAED